MKTLIESNEIPIIDLKLTELTDSPPTELIERLANELDAALHSCGTALLINHGVSTEKQIKASEYFAQFCALPDDIKENCSRLRNHGYVRPGAERFDKSAIEIRHSFNFGTTNAEKFPSDSQLPGWRAIILDLVTDMNRLEALILKALAQALNVPIDFLIGYHTFLSDAIQLGTTFRLLYYPPVSSSSSSSLSSSRPLNATRCGAHTDYGTFTLLWQDTEGGLEVVKAGTTEWRRVGHLPDAILINGGAILDAWSENRYPALLHRVVIPEENDLRNAARFSQAFFVHSTPESLVGPLRVVKDLKDDDDEGRKQFIMAQQYLEQKFMETYGKPN